MSTKCPSCDRVVSEKSKECPYCYANFVSNKRILPALILCFFFGIFGVHRFYAGKIGTGALQVLLLLMGVSDRGFLILLFLWVIIDFIMITAGAFNDKKGKKLALWT